MSTVIKGSASGQINLNDTTGSIQLNGSDVLTIDSSGNLTAPNNLTVTGTVTQTGGATFNGGITGNVAFDTNTLYVDATNNRVGIGTSSPTEGQLVVRNDSGDAKLNIKVNSFDGTNGVAALDFSTGGQGANDPQARIHALGANNYSANIVFSTQQSGTTNPLVERMRIDSSGNLKFDSGYGSVATAYGCRAWVNFNGTGTVAIRDSGNVSSITDSGVGDYRVNFSTAMPDTDYAVVGSCQGVSGSDIVDFGSFGYGGAPSVTPTTSQVAVGAFAYSGASVDTPIVSVAVFR